MTILRTINSITAIDIVWQGPFSTDDVIQNKNRNVDYGIYQIYGTHPILGVETLLYLGRSTETGSKFGGRLGGHTWIRQEPRAVRIFLGYLGGTSPVPATQNSQEEWGNWIVIAEGILIYFCRPPRNSHGIQNCPLEPPVIIFNTGERHSLPSTLSNLYLKSPALIDRAFNIFEEPDIVSP